MTIIYYHSKRFGDELHVRFAYKRGCDFRLATGIEVPRASWDRVKQKVIIPRIPSPEKTSLTHIQNAISGLSALLSERAVCLSGVETKSWWQQQIRDYNAKRLGFIPVHSTGRTTSPQTESPSPIRFSLSIGDLFDIFIQQRCHKKMRRKQMEVAKRALLRYILYIGWTPQLSEWDDSLLCGMEHFLAIEHTFFHNGECVQFDELYKQVPGTRTPIRQRGWNTIHSILKKLRTFFGWCVKTKRITSSPFEQYTLRACVYGESYYLTKEELDHLYNFDFGDKKWLATQRDVFVLQSQLGMRIGDFYSLTSMNIINDTVQYIASKTRGTAPRTIVVPLSAKAKAILAKYHKDGALGIMPFISEQHYNQDIKKMLRMAGIDRIVTILNPKTGLEEQHPIWEVASSHMARRNFVGILWKATKDPDLIGSMTGHVPGSKAFARYRKIDLQSKQELINIL